jgi:DNA-directed RNA polymerase specialized sigma24 family protein
MTAYSIVGEGLDIKRDRAPGAKFPSASELHTIRNKTAEGFNSLYANTAGAIFSVITWYIQDSTVAEDLLQCTFVKIWKQIDNYSEFEMPLLTWILTIARDVCLGNQNVRRTAASGASDIEHIHYIPVVTLIFYYGYNYNETAALLGIPVVDMKQYARQGLWQLRAIVTS